MIDTRWMAHLQEMDYLKAGIGLRAFGQRDPLVEYKNEAYNAFQNLTAGMYEDYLRTLLRLQVAVKQEQPALAEDKSPLDGKVSYSCLRAGISSRRAWAPRASRRPASPSGAPGGSAQARGGEAPDVHEGQGRSLRQRRAQRAVPLRHRASSTRSVTDEINKESWLIETKKTWRR